MATTENHSVTIAFDGICTHFRGVVPGVPHRVVLPDATELRGGALQVGEEQSVPYLIHPHMAILVSGNKPLDITVPGLIENGIIQAGVRLQIANPTTGNLTYPPDSDYGNLLSLAQFVENYRPSSDVLLGGRARCYFDFFGGVLQVVADGDSTNTMITVETIGSPRLQITPLLGDPTSSPAVVEYRDLPSEIVVMNFCETGAKFDFLLNYLTAEGGLPRAVFTGFPTDDGTDAVPPLAADDLRALLGQCDFGKMAAHKDEGTSAACSDSRYP